MLLGAGILDCKYVKGYDSKYKIILAIFFVRDITSNKKFVLFH